VDDSVTLKVSQSSTAIKDKASSGFASNRVVIIVGAAVLVLLLAAAAVFLVFNFLEGSVENLLQDTQPVANEGIVPTATVEISVEPGLVPYTELFTFRDIFDPVLKPSLVATPAQEATPALDPDVLYLLNIVVEDGVSRALLELDGTQHTLAEGESIPGTPWLLQSINSGSVVMLFGDVPITLAIGHGVITDETVPGARVPIAK